MPNSMTGYGRSRQTLGGRDILVEIKSVNHRYFEYSAKLPRSYGYLEEKLKNLVAGVASRGKLEVSVSISGGNTEGAVTLNTQLAQDYLSAFRSAKDFLELEDDLTLRDLLSIDGLFTVNKVPEDEAVIWEQVQTVAKEALAGFAGMRATEGEKLKQDVSDRLQTIETYVGRVEVLSPKTVEAYQKRLTDKLHEILETKNIDEARVLTEVALFADKIAVDEETVRLRSHLGQFTALLEANEPVGRKLDFLLQEINREVNTIGSKCQDLEVTEIVVALKAEIEKIREQIQNME